MTSLARVTRCLLATGGRRYSSRMTESTTRDSDERPSLFWRMMAPFQSLTGMVFNRSVSSSPVIHGKCGVLKDGEDPKDLSESEWKARLDPEQYEITRGKGTERAFSGKYYYHHEKGTYACSCCGVPLFSSSTKYESGSGWPSFYEALRDPGLDESASNVKRHTDMSHGMVRTEVTCKQCDAHLGHVFPDGPKETGERFCINSASLAFDPGCGESKM